MVDERIDVPGLSVEAGRPATLTTEQALNYEMADETAETMIEMLKIYDLGDAEIGRDGDLALLVPRKGGRGQGDPREKKG